MFKVLNLLLNGMSHPNYQPNGTSNNILVLCGTPSKFSLAPGASMDRQNVCMLYVIIFCGKGCCQWNGHFNRSSFSKTIHIVMNLIMAHWCLYRHLCDLSELFSEIDELSTVNCKTSNSSCGIYS